LPIAVRLNRFDLNLLAALDALLQERSVSRAAQRLGMSQSAMSAALHHLREYFNDPLLTPIGRGLTLSPRGLALIEPVRQSLVQIEAVLDAPPPQLNLATMRRAFRVVIADFLTPLLAPRILATIRRLAPGIQLHIEPVTDISIRRLMSGDVDACYWPYDLSLFGLDIEPSGLRIRQIQPVPWVCIASQDNSALAGGLTPELYLSLSHVVPRPSLGANNLDVLWKRLFRLELNIAASTNSTLDLAPIVAATDLIATVPKSLLSLIPRDLPISDYPVPFDLPVSQEVLVWHRRYDDEPAHMWLRELFVSI
jgi:DNA-binding transcriptional LysR family regulator